MDSNSPAELPLALPASFPSDDYTPHGYIDNPFHSMVLNRSGVLRSVPPLGLGYWRRRFRGSYGEGPRAYVNYVSLLQISVVCDDLRLVTSEDFARAGVELVSRYHTKHALSYDWRCRGLTFRLLYFLPREHTLACQVEVRNDSPGAQEIFLHATHIYGLWETRWWGSDGVAMRYLSGPDAAVSAIWAYGDLFALGASARSVAHKATASARQREDWIRANDLSSAPSASVRGPGPLYAMMTYRLGVAVGSRTRLLICLARAANDEAVLRELRTGLGEALPTLLRQLTADDAFWQVCPQLEGDWPTTWKHGWVYDWETLRMNVRPPAGIFRRPWDGMQVHSPRCVLAETSLDMLTLSHADAPLARQVLLGTFEDAVAPNVPCCREDGSLNMIAEDGQACGTSPAWCLPFHVLRAVWAMSGDRGWLDRLYPYLSRFLKWWLTHRTGPQGGLHCHCDWESGQDGSKRFPQTEGGVTDAVRALDVEASMAEALQIMATFARLTGRTADETRWRALAQQRTTAVRGMFVDGAFRDFDATRHQPILLPDYADVMMLTPLACGVATAEQVQACRRWLEYFREHPALWLEWPSFFLVYTEAAWTAGLRKLAAAATADIADRVYSRLDARAPHYADPTDPFSYRVPGVANEYWPLSAEAEPGGENYGWGATLPLHIIRSLLGFRETADYDAPAFHLSPCLPLRLRIPGRSYGLRNLHFRGLDLAIRCEVADADTLRVALDFCAPRPLELCITDSSGRRRGAVSASHGRGALCLEAVEGEVLVVRAAPEGPAAAATARESDG